MKISHENVVVLNMSGYWQRNRWSFLIFFTAFIYITYCEAVYIIIIILMISIIANRINKVDVRHDVMRIRRIDKIWFYCSEMRIFYTEMAVLVKITFCLKRNKFLFLEHDENYPDVLIIKTRYSHKFLSRKN